MFDYKRLLKKSMQSHTLLTDTVGWGLCVGGYADKYLAGLVTMYKSYSWLRKRFLPFVGQCEKREQKPAAKDYVWVCWFQGMENAPDIVKACHDSMQHWLDGKELIVITRENYEQYAQLPDFIVEKWEKGILSDAHFSDLLRLELLIRHGGLWLDATAYLTGSLPSYITDSDFFVYRNGWMDREMIHMASWLIGSRRTGHPLLVETQALLYRYWEKYNYLKNYFLMHMFFRMATEAHEEEWAAVPYYNQIDNHLMAQVLEMPYSEHRLREICRQTPVHKLTYKLNALPPDCVAEHLGEIYESINLDRGC